MGDIENDWFFTTSEDLIEALGPAGRDYATPQQYADSVDLSFVDPTLAASDRQAALEQVKAEGKRQDALRIEKGSPTTRKSLLVKYLLHVDPVVRYEARLMDPEAPSPRLDEALLTVFDPGVRRWLELVRLDISHVMSWAWVLTADSSERAAWRLTILAQQCSKKEDIFRNIPSFVLLFLLRRQSIDARALRLLLTYVWNLMEISESFNPTNSKDGSSTPSGKIFKRAIVKDSISCMPETIFIILIIRLLRRATTVWPAACESIVSLLNRYMDGNNSWKGNSRSAWLREQDDAHLTFMYNTMLKLLATPSNLHPFHSVIYQQRAQFSVLRKMDQFRPPVIVDKRGYQAVAKVQLMHKKTIKEREWANMKAKSWPPWKEEKLGIDAYVGVEQGISRAKEALNRAKEAGYSTDDWGAAAGILSGWDTDGSPTIQTRAIHDFPSDISAKARGSLGATIWAARIEATRTIDEAWSCFLSYMDDPGALNLVGEKIYFAMFQKLVHNAKRSSKKMAENPMGTVPDERPLPGDGLEVLPTPVSPREATYVRRPPPTLDEFMEMMVSKRVRPSGQFLSFLLRNAWSFEAGVRCVECSSLSPQQLSALFDASLVRDAQSQAALESLPGGIFAAFIQFLCRFSPKLSNKGGFDSSTQVATGQVLAASRIALTRDFKDSGDTPLPRDSPFNTLWTAHKLLLDRQPKSRPAWYHIFRVLSGPKTVISLSSNSTAQDVQDVRSWKLICRLLNRMFDTNVHLDLEGLGLICRGLEKAIFASERRLRIPNRAWEQGQGECDMWLEHDVLSQGLPLVKILFKDAVRCIGMQQEIPAAAMAEKSKLDIEIENAQDDAKLAKSVEDDFDQAEIEDYTEHLEDINSTRAKAFLPPACLLPKLIEVPHPWLLHAFIRVLGLRRDYEGIWETIEWMSIYANELDTMVDQSMNGRRIMRRCITATRVFLERSWMTVKRDDECNSAGFYGIMIEADPAPVEIIRAVRELVLTHEIWGGWATDTEVAEYCATGSFL